MITLITGTPGSGKTAYALDMMLRLQKLDNSRKLFVHGIPNLKVPHEIVVCDSKTCDYCTTLLDRDSHLHAAKWHEWAEQGSIFFFDEVQNIHRPRHGSAAVPDCVATYEVHRHRGLDFFMITQNPMLIDGNIRALVSRHIHLTATWARRVQHEWAQCKTDLSSTLDESIKSSYVLPKNVFKLYKSASLHTSVSRKKPWVLYALPVLVIVIFWMIHSFQTRVKDAAKPKPPISTHEISSLTPANSTPVSLKTGGAEVAGQPASIAPPLNAKRQILDMPKLFKNWSQFGIRDDELKFLPIHMCAVSSMSFVKCHFPQKLSFKHFFSSIACTPDNCFAFLKRISPVELRQHEPMSTPQLPFSADSITQASK
jgi:zona occludens toxin